MTVDRSRDIQWSPDLRVRFITPREAAVILGVRATTAVARLQRLNPDRIHRYKLGSHPHTLRYSREEIVAFKAAHPLPFE